MELWKMKGSQMDISNSRDVTVCDQDAKTVGSHARAAVHVAAGNLMMPTAMGSGFNGGACDTAHLLVPQNFALAMAQNVSSYCLFSDLRAAFASMHRRISLLSEDDGDEIWPSGAC